MQFRKGAKRLNTEFSILRENWTTFFITVNKYFSPLLTKFFVRLTAALHFISQNSEAIDHLVPEIKIIMTMTWRFRINTPEYYKQKWPNVTQEKEVNIDICFYTERIFERNWKNIAIIAIHRGKIYFVDTFGDFSHTVEWNSLKSVW